MARRAYICPIVHQDDGTGTGEWHYAPTVPEGFPALGEEVSSPIQRNPQTGVPLYAHTLIVVTAEDFSAFDADPETYVPVDTLPDPVTPGYAYDLLVALDLDQPWGS